MAETEQHVVKRVCPSCDGIGSPVNGRIQTQDPKCPLCEDRGWVTNVVCKGCGRPAYFSKDDIAFCGQNKCWDKLKPTKVIEITTRGGEVMSFNQSEAHLARSAWQRITHTERERDERTRRFIHENTHGYMD
jgi:hypothetical protein